VSQDVNTIVDAQQPHGSMLEARPGHSMADIHRPLNIVDVNLLATFFA
jgi:hypothetical protein